MDLNNLPPELDRKLQIIGFSEEVEAEDEKRRKCTTFGYNRGGLPIMVLWMALPFFASGLAIVGLAIYAPTSGTYMSTSPLPWFAILPPFILAPVIPFLFLKLRYALRAFAFVLVVFVAIILLCGLGDSITGAVL